MRTNIDKSGTPAMARFDDYAGPRDRAHESVRANVSAGDDPSLVARALLEAATAQKPRLRYPVGKRAGLLARLRRFMPAGVFDSALRKQFGLDPV